MDIYVTGLYDDLWVVRTNAGFSDFSNCLTSGVPFSTQPITLSTSAIGELSTWDVSSPASDFTINNENFLAIDISECPVDQPEGCELVSTKDLYPEWKLSLYPNPTTGVLNLEGDWTLAENVVLYDLGGRQVDKQEINSTQLNLAHLPVGTYLLHFIDKNNRRLGTSRLFIH